VDAEHVVAKPGLVDPDVADALGRTAVVEEPVAEAMDEDEVGLGFDRPLAEDDDASASFTRLPLAPTGRDW
jgi:hypothetical protein